jgi:hypothetical protein
VRIWRPHAWHRLHRHETIVAQVQDTSTGYATDVACVHALDQTNYDPQPGNDCEIATVAIDPSKTPSPAPSGVTHGGAAETLPPASTVAAPQTNTGGSKPAGGSCPAYTRQGRRYTILSDRKLTCAQGLTVTRHADRALHRTGVFVNVSSWLCRREHLAGQQAMWLEACTRAGGRSVIWTEQRRRLDRGSGSRGLGRPPGRTVQTVIPQQQDRAA